MKKRIPPWEAMNVTEYKLWEKMQDYDEKYFSDMRLMARKLRSKIRKAKFEDDDGKWKTYYEDFPLDQNLPGVDEWYLKIVKFKEEGLRGRCIKRKKIVEVLKDPNRSLLKTIILHELIHVYEFIYEEHWFLKAYREFLLLYLYRKLEEDTRVGPKVLEDFINFDIHILIHQRDKHSLLFLLKALDLDLRLKKPLGTVYSYGRLEIFNDIKRDAEKKVKKETN